MLKQKWIEATSRERLLVIVMGVVVCCAALIAVLVRPAWRVMQTAPAALSALDAKVLTMRTQAAYLRAVPVAPPMAMSPIQSAERELKSTGATVGITHNAAGAGQGTTTISLNGVEGPRLAAWLASPEVARQLQRLSLTRDPQSGRVTGTAVLRAPS